VEININSWRSNT